MSSVRDIQHEVASARNDVRADFEALGRKLGRDERQLKGRMHEYGPFIAAGAGSLGILLGFGGPKWIRRLLVVGVIGGIAAAVITHNKK